MKVPVSTALCTPPVSVTEHGSDGYLNVPTVTGSLSACDALDHACVIGSTSRHAGCELSSPFRVPCARSTFTRHKLESSRLLPSCVMG